MILSHLNSVSEYFIYLFCFQRRQRAERLGDLCAFYERAVPDLKMATSGGQPDAALYVTIQSAYNKDWYLGFGPNPIRRSRVRKKSKKRGL